MARQLAVTAGVAGQACAGGLWAVLLMLLLAGCGGGGSRSVASGGAAASALAASCATPRHGTDPITGQVYPDRQGSLLDEQNWLTAWTNDLYLWYNEVPVLNPAAYTTAIDYFAKLKTSARNPSGSAKDRFHFTYPTAQWEAISQGSATVGYGLSWDIVASAPPRQVVVAYLEPNLPAGMAPPAVVRGTRLITIDGVAVADGAAAALNAGLTPVTVGEQHLFEVQDPGSAVTRFVTLSAASVTETPVQNVQTLAGGSVGYLQFNDHIATAEAELVAAINTLRNAGISDLVLDIRYNGGGYLDIASELAYMIAGPTRTSGQTFELTHFNAKHPTIDPVSLVTITPVPFHAVTQGFSLAANQALPSLGLSRVFVLTGSGTCSASESVINSLRGIGVTVIQVGSTTCGKPYGFYPADNCGTTYFSIQFQGVNAAGFGNYPDGFVPLNGNTSGIDPLAQLPGCSVGDDFSHALGDPAEARLAAALQYLNTASCPVPSGLGSPAVASATDLISHSALIGKSPFRANRVLIH